MNNLESTCLENSEHLSRFKEWLIIKGHTRATSESYGNTTSRFLVWLEQQGIAPEQVSYHDVLGYISYCRSKGNKSRTLQIIAGVLKHFYYHLQGEGQVGENPASEVGIKGVKRKVLYEVLSVQELEQIYQSYCPTIDVEEIKKIKNTPRMPPQYLNELARKRNKVILGLIIYQGIRTEELAKLELQDLSLREGKVTIQSGKRTEGRTMKLEAHQVYDLMDYVHQTRRQILEATKKNSTKVFISVGSSLKFNNIIAKLMKSIQADNKKVKDIKQIRTSVICNWLKIYNLRKAQYLAGHRYVSSTEAYQVNNMEELQDDIKKYHPIG